MLFFFILLFISLKEQEIYEKKGHKDNLQANIDSLKVVLPKSGEIFEN